jgi:hypothetical protein
MTEIFIFSLLFSSSIPSGDIVLYSSFMETLPTTTEWSTLLFQVRALVSQPGDLIFSLSVLQFSLIPSDNY